MTQPDYDPDDNDVRDASITDTTRRGALAALGLGGLAALGSGHATADLAGGPESDAMSEFRVPMYRVPESDLDSPGVVGRRVEITSGGGTYSAGDQLVDTGSSWELVSAGVESLNTDQEHNGDNPFSGRLQRQDGQLVVSGRDGEIASGSDVGSVINSALSSFPGSASNPAQGGRIALPVGLFNSVETTIGLTHSDQLVGEHIRASQLRQADAANLSNLVEFEGVGSPQFFAGLFDLKLHGNKANNSSGNGLRVYKSDADANDVHIERVFADKFPDSGFVFDFIWGLHIDHWLSERNGSHGMELNGGSQAYIGDGFTAYHTGNGVNIDGLDRSRIRGVNSRQNFHGFQQISGSQVTYNDCHAYRNDFDGFRLRSNHNTVVGGSAGNNGQSNSGAAGYKLDAPNISLHGVEAYDDQSTATQDYGVNVQQNFCSIIGGEVYGNATADINIASGVVETMIMGVDYDTITDNGSRTIYNGFSENAGDPSSTGVWSNFPDVAWRKGVTVVDTSTEGDLYHPLPPSATNDWVRVSGTAV